MPSQAVARSRYAGEDVQESQTGEKTQALARSRQAGEGYWSLDIIR